MLENLRCPSAASSHSKAVFHQAPCPPASGLQHANRSRRGITVGWTSDRGYVVKIAVLDMSNRVVPWSELVSSILRTTMSDKHAYHVLAAQPRLRGTLRYTFSCWLAMAATRLKIGFRACEMPGMGSSARWHAWATIVTTVAL